MGAVLFQIVLLDIVFSLDSVLTAVGMADEIAVMVVGGGHRRRRDAVRLGADLALRPRAPDGQDARALVPAADRRDAASPTGSAFHVEKGYVYAAMGFSVFVEALNLAAARRRRRGQAPWSCTRPS